MKYYDIPNINIRLGSDNSFKIYRIGYNGAKLGVYDNHDQLMQGQCIPEDYREDILKAFMYFGYSQ